MALHTVKTLFDRVKRDSGLGEVGDYSTTSQANLDLLDFLNQRDLKIWNRWNWDFSETEIDYTQSATVAAKTLPSTIGEIIILTINGGEEIPEKTKRQYHKWNARRDTETETGEIIGFYRVGRDSTGALKIRFFPAPESDTTIKGWGRTRRTPYTTADITAATSIAYYPDEFQAMLYDFMLADALGVTRDARQREQLARAEKALDDAVKAVANRETLVPTNPPPDLIVYGRRKRGGTSVV